MNKSPIPRASISGHIHPKPTLPKGFRKSQAKIAPIKIFVSNNKYFTYALERISFSHPSSNNYVVVGTIEESPALKAKKRESISKEPLILSYQKVNIISYKIAHTAFIEGENMNTEHICKMDNESLRCTICGCHMGWMFSVDGMNYPQPVRIEYFDYESIFFEENFSNDNFISLKSIRNLMILRKFFSYIMERTPGLGFQELYEKYKLINLFPLQVYKELGISYRELLEKKNEDFRIFADFEGANLQAYEYIIQDDICKIRFLMRGDTNVTEMENNTFWFYFKIVVKRCLKIEFELLNYKEQSKLLGDQMMIFVNDERFIDINENYFPGKSRWRSFKDDVFLQTNEYRTARYRSISIEPNQEPADDNNNEENLNNEVKKKFFSLKFHYLFDKATKNSPEEILFAYGIPYTYNDLLAFLTKQEKRLFSKAMQEQKFDLKTKRILLRNDLIHYEWSIISPTRCGVPIFLLKITSSITADETDTNEYFPISSKKKKKSIVFFARQHPYETATSWIIEGIINTLLNDTKKINLLRTFFNFYIVPMVNVDGVIAGNTMAGVSGADFNRIWNDPIKDVHPEVYHIKEFFTKIQNEVIVFFDLHSTNQKSGVFLYGNPPSLDINTCMLNEENIEKYLIDFAESLLLPKLFESQSCYFNQAECKYKVTDKNKENTARNIFHKNLKIKHCFSLVSSLYYYEDNKEKYRKDFKLDDYKNVGKDCLNVLFSFLLILAETWISNEKKTLEKADKTKESDSPSMRRSDKREKSIKEEEKFSKHKEREKYFYHHLQRIKTEFEINTDCKSYFKKKELKFMKFKAKKRLIPLQMLQPLDKNKKNNTSSIITTKNKNQLELEMSDFLHSLIEKYEDQEENENDLSKSHDFFDGNISVESEKVKSPGLDLMKNKSKGIINFYKDQMRGFNEKNSKSQSFLQLNYSSDLQGQGKDKSLFNSTILNENSSQLLKKDNNSLDKSLSFNNKSTSRLDFNNNKTKLFKNKSTLNLSMQENENENNLDKSSILPFTQEIFSSTEKSTLPTFNLTSTLLFKRSEFIKKIREKLKVSNEIQIEELKKLKIPIRRNFHDENYRGENMREHGIEKKKYPWRLKRPCCQGLIPMNPFIKHKKELINLYSFHQKSSSLDKNPTNKESPQINKSNKEINLDKEEVIANEDLKKLESLQMQNERNIVGFSPWSQKQTES